VVTGLPIGLQIIGGYGRDQQVLAAAAAFERAHGYHTMLPREVLEEVEEEGVGGTANKAVQGTAVRAGVSD
jgi:hypothetical protein